jgi:predicted enzyme related to lactoylglutathione lyase
MITGLGGVSIWSSDLNNLLPFYRDVVGLKVGISTERFVLFGDQSSPALALGSHSEIHGPATDPYRCMVGLLTDDIVADCARIKAAGTEFIEEPNEQPDGGLLLATFKDPEGNLVQLFQFTS